MKSNIQKVCSSNERIKQLIEINNLSQTEFCEKTGLKKSAVSNYLNGDRLPRQDQLSKIADAFDVSAAWLMGYDVPMILDQPNITGSMTKKGACFTIREPVHSIETYVEMIYEAEKCTQDQIMIALATLRAFSSANKRKEDS